MTLTYHIDRFMTDPVPLELSAPQALRLIRSIAADTSKIVVIQKSHAAQRQLQRKVTRRQIELCVQKGTIVEGPFKNQFGNWQVTLFRHAAGEELHCVIAIERKEQLIVVTVY